MAKVVCAKCKADWRSASNPGRCPVCEQVSFGIAVPVTRTNDSREPNKRAKSDDRKGV